MVVGDTQIEEKEKETLITQFYNSIVLVRWLNGEREWRIEPDTKDSYIFAIHVHACDTCIWKKTR